jgi:hypothetical protein
MANFDDQFDLIDQADALESFRSSDFDCFSAYGEVLDNSIQANASIIKVQFLEKNDPSAKQKMISEVLFADNGEGMNQDVLRKCLKLGYSSRKNDRNGIGRFGVGMTLGAINQCRRIEVYSKVNGGGWFYVYLDFDDVSQKKQKFFPIPELSHPPKEISNFINESGTVVRWTKYDNQEFPFHTVLEESKIFFGRTYRKFIWGTAINFGPISIFVNNQEVNAIDPLFVTKIKTGFENEDPAELLKPNKIEELIPNDHPSDRQKSPIYINMSILPETYRRERGMGGDSFAKERYIDRNGGVSILRNDREVFYGRIPYWTNYWEDEVTRFIGMEISFNAEIDKLFKVRNIKRGALPYGDLNKRLKESMEPTLRNKIDFIKNKWNEINLEKAKNNEDENSVLNISNKHNTTNSILKANKADLMSGDKQLYPKKDKVIATTLKPSVFGNDIEIKEVIESLKNNGITIDEQPFVGTSFIDIQHGNGLKTMIYNTNSAFFRAYSTILEELESNNKKIADDYKVLIDLIFVGYMLAESKIDPLTKYDGEEFLEEIKSNWSKELSKILKKWQN